MHKHKTAEELTPEQRDSEEILYALRKKGKNALRFNLVLQAFTLLTAIGTLVFYFVEEEQGLDITINHMFQCISALVILNIPLLITRKFKCYIPSFITVILYIYIFAHFILGEIYRAYDRVFLYDKILHTTGGFIFAILSFSIVWLLNNREGNKVKFSPFFIVLFTFCFTMTAEYLWELIEFGVDRLFGANMQRWQDSIIEGAQIIVNGETVEGTAHSVPYGNGLSDTMGDMFVNILGCLVVCTISYIGMRVKPNWFENKVILTQKQFRALLERESQGKEGTGEPVVSFVQINRESNTETGDEKVSGRKSSEGSDGNTPQGAAEGPDGNAPQGAAEGPDGNAPQGPAEAQAARRGKRGKK